MLLRIERRLGDALGDDEHVLQVEGEVPARVVLPVALDQQVLRPLLERLDALQRAGELLTGADDALRAKAIHHPAQDRPEQRGLGRFERGGAGERATAACGGGAGVRGRFDVAFCLHNSVRHLGSPGAIASLRRQ